MIHQYILDHPNNKKLYSQKSYSTYTIYENIFDCIDLIREMISMCDTISVDDFMILMVAIKKSQYDIIYILINKGIDLNKEVGYSSTYIYKTRFPLEIAIVNRDKEMCDFLIQNGCDITIRKDRFFNLCITSNDYDFISYFLIYYPNLNIFSDFLNTCYNLEFNIFSIFINTGFKMNRIDVNRDNVCSYMSNYTIHQFTFLVNNGLILVNKMLVFAIKKNDINLVEYLLQYGLNFDKNITYDIFYDGILPNIKQIRMLLKYECDLSLVKERVVNDYSTEIKNYGHDIEFILNVLMNF